MNTITTRLARTTLLLTLLSLGAARTHAQDGPGHPGVAVEMVVRYSLESSDEWNEVPLTFTSMVKATQLDREVAPPGLETSFRIAEFLPLAVPQQRIEPDTSAAARPAVSLSIQGPKLSYERCMIADSPSRNRMTSLIATWRYAAASTPGDRDRLYASFLEEPTREPTLLIGSADGGPVHSLPVVPGGSEKLNELDCVVRVVEFFSHYNFDERSGTPLNLSDERRNPAALVHIEGPGGWQEERWVFARFPDYTDDDAAASRYSVVLECPVEKESPTPDYVIAFVGESRHQLWTRFAGEASSRTLATMESVSIPGSRYTFKIGSFLPAARLVEEFVPTTERRGSSSALRIDFTDADGRADSRWLEMGREVRLPLRGDLVTVSFAPKHGG